jgi:hypothetical protein
MACFALARGRRASEANGLAAGLHTPVRGGGSEAGVRGFTLLTVASDINHPGGHGGRSPKRRSIWSVRAPRPHDEFTG